MVFLGGWGLCLLMLSIERPMWASSCAILWSKKKKHTLLKVYGLCDYDAIFEDHDNQMNGD
jgi:hypothetical protein